MMVKRLCACALWSSEMAVSSTGASVLTSALPSEGNQSHNLPLSLSHHLQHCQNSAHGISTFILFPANKGGTSRPLCCEFTTVQSSEALLEPFFQEMN